MKTLQTLALMVAIAAGPAGVFGATDSTPGLPGAAAAEQAKAPLAAPAGAPAASSPVASTPAESKDVVGAVAKPPTLSPRFQQVRDRIDALFRHRNGMPSPPPDPRLNPFRPPGAAPVAAKSPTGPQEPPAGASIPAPLSSDLELLQQAVATLRVSGVVEKGGQAHLAINAKSYKVGEVIQTKVKGESVFLRVRNISRNSVTLGLNSTEMTLKF